jgi:hypothetical protein
MEPWMSAALWCDTLRDLGGDLLGDLGRNALTHGLYCPRHVFTHENFA